MPGCFCRCPPPSASIISLPLALYFFKRYSLFSFLSALLLIPISIVILCNFNDNGTALNYTSFIQDISTRQNLEAEKSAMEIDLRNSQRLKAIVTLASGIAHEINNPINGIMNYSQLILDESKPESEFRQK